MQLNMSEHYGCEEIRPVEEYLRVRQERSSSNTPNGSGGWIKCDSNKNVTVCGNNVCPYHELVMV